MCATRLRVIIPCSLAATQSRGRDLSLKLVCLLLWGKSVPAAAASRAHQLGAAPSVTQWYLPPPIPFFPAILRRSVSPVVGRLSCSEYSGIPPAPPLSSFSSTTYTTRPAQGDRQVFFFFFCVGLEFAPSKLQKKDLFYRCDYSNSYLYVTERKHHG